MRSVALGAEPLHLAHEGVLRPERPRLLEGAVGEVGAADPAREAGVVADQRAGAGLAADRLLLDDQGGEPLRGGVDGRGEAGRPGAHDHDVVHVVGRRRPRQAEGVGDLEVGRVHQRRRRGGEGEHDHRQGRVLQPEARPASARPRPCRPRGSATGMWLRPKESRREWVRSSRCSPMRRTASKPMPWARCQSSSASVRAPWNSSSRGRSGRSTSELGVAVGDGREHRRTCSRSLPRPRRRPAWRTGAGRRPGAGSRGRRGRRARSSR